MKQISILSLILVFSAGSSLGMEQGGNNNGSMAPRTGTPTGNYTYAPHTTHTTGSEFKFVQPTDNNFNAQTMNFTSLSRKNAYGDEPIATGALKSAKDGFLNGVERSASDVTGVAIGHIVIETVKGTYHFFVPDLSQAISKADEQLKIRVSYRQLVSQSLEMLKNNPFVSPEEYEKIQLMHFSQTPTEKALKEKFIFAHDIAIKQLQLNDTIECIWDTLGLQKLAEKMLVQKEGPNPSGNNTDEKESLKVPTTIKQALLPQLLNQVTLDGKVTLDGYSQQLLLLYGQQSREYVSLLDACVNPSKKTPQEEQAIRHRIQKSIIENSQAAATSTRETYNTIKDTYAQHETEIKEKAPMVALGGVVVYQALKAIHGA